MCAPPRFCTQLWALQRYFCLFVIFSGLKSTTLKPIYWFWANGEGRFGNLPNFLCLNGPSKFWFQTFYLFAVELKQMYSNKANRDDRDCELTPERCFVEEHDKTLNCYLLIMFITFAPTPHHPMGEGEII